MTENELYHHGILGQKWGVRRYQNEDGSLTSAGRSRYGVSEKTRAKDLAKYNKYMAEAAKYDAKASKAWTRRGRIRKMNTAEAYRGLAKIRKNMMNAETKKDRFWEGHGNRYAAVDEEVRAKQYKNIADNSRFKLTRAMATSASYNASTRARINKRVAETTGIGKKIAKRYTSTNTSMFETTGGRHINGGAMTAHALIGTVGNVVLPGVGAGYMIYQDMKGYKKNRKDI